MVTHFTVYRLQCTTNSVVLICGPKKLQAWEFLRHKNRHGIAKVCYMYISSIGNGHKTLVAKSW